MVSLAHDVAGPLIGARGQLHHRAAVFFFVVGSLLAARRGFLDTHLPILSVQVLVVAGSCDRTGHHRDRHDFPSSATLVHGCTTL